MALPLEAPEPGEVTRSVWISVVSDGTGAELIPRGNVKGQVLDSLGKEPGEAKANQRLAAR